jgi:GC-rich sequence DNA-binding factor
VLEVAPTVFADAAEEFASLEAVKAKLEGWKAAYRQDYQNAYVAESAPALFAPFVRLQLLQWDPLYYKSSSSTSSSADGGGSGGVAGRAREGWREGWEGGQGGRAGREGWQGGLGAIDKDYIMHKSQDCSQQWAGWRFR